MQTTLASRIEKIWAMADIAVKHGYIDYGLNGHSRVVNIAGAKFDFDDNVLTRVRAPRFDVQLSYSETSENVVTLMGSQTQIHFVQGDDEGLDRSYQELLTLQSLFSPVRKAA